MIAGYDAYKLHACHKTAAVEESAQWRIITSRRNLESHLRAMRQMEVGEWNMQELRQ